ncbi:SDR family oxidoreductase [Methylobacterium platani]|uniref:Short-chain dehydrogenase n=2 Tax=Methylobacterium platani TaxID=427683 RepID=A0A179SCQ5_9HYPH|nr:SDR family oxidoreductase [Methylobacterium platani]KMO11305.1 short-chain dehydrogenase [Methylobacterium platani JCM 14648]OAS24169.1 short-chain dehydrogenase [Methylobacterium platani]
MARVAVVTGGTAGIGLATAHAFARDGWAVGIVARDQDRLRDAEAALRRHGGAVMGISADVADVDAVNAAADRFEAELGPVDTWVNNAMSSIVAPVPEITPEEWRRVTETTYLSQVWGTLAALRHMRRRNRGTIVQVSSGLGLRAMPLQVPYCAAKHAVTGFTDGLRSELLHERVDIGLTVVYLPAVNTPQFGWARTRTGAEQDIPAPVFDPRLCADAILFAARNRRRDIWVGRSTVQMGLMQVVSPALSDRLMARGWDAQIGQAAPDKPGNLFDPAPGPAAIDGRFADKTSPTRSEFVTDRQRDLLVGGLAALCLGGAAALALGGAATRRLARRRRRILPRII